MVQRKFILLSSVFFVTLFSLFIIVTQSHAVACNGGCGGSITCDAGLSCVGGVCKPPSPSCSGGYPQSATTNATSGNFNVYAQGVANATSVTFPTWSSVSGQDDLVNPWYAGTNQGGGIWYKTVNLGAHSAGAGTINTHIYMNNCGYTNVWCGTANFDICPVAVACPGTCHTDTQTKPDGVCGTTTCPPNAPAYQADVACTTVPISRSNGDCTTRTQVANNPAYQADVACTTVPISRSNGDCTTRTQVANNPAATIPPTCGTASSGPDGSCGTWVRACQSQAPQMPNITSPTPGSCLISKPTITWNSFAATGCAGAWGYSCIPEVVNNKFRILDGATLLGTATSGSTSYTITTALSHGAHTIWVCANNGERETCKSIAITVDSTAPAAPTLTSSLIPDGTCLGRSNLKLAWNAPLETGCASTNALPFWVQGANSNAIDANGGFTDMVNSGWTSQNTWLNPSNASPPPTYSETSTASLADSYAPGKTIYYHGRSRDAFDNQSLWTATQSITVPVPVAYEVIHITGSYSEDVGGLCDSNITIDKNALNLNPVVTFNPTIPLNLANAGITTSCAATSDTAYSCDITINNTTGLCVNQNVTLTLNASYPGYSSINWRAGDVCAGAEQSFKDLTAVPPNNTSVHPLFFTYDGSGGAGGWFKLSQTSFNSRMSGRRNFIPNSLRTFDTTDNNTNKNLIIGSAGNIVQNGALNVGASSVPYSTPNWYTSGYSHIDDISYSKYIDYIKARKDFTTITNVNLSEITGNGIYYIKNSVTLSANQFDGKNVVLVADGGDVTINANFIPVGGSVAILAKNIKIDPAVSEIDAILIGQTVTTGDGLVGLKIKGNLIDEAEMTIERNQADGRKPSLYVVFDPQMYMNILPYLSTSTYDWRQIQ